MKSDGVHLAPVGHPARSVADRVIDPIFTATYSSVSHPERGLFQYTRLLPYPITHSPIHDIPITSLQGIPNPYGLQVVFHGITEASRLAGFSRE
ncbi:unnamed protein product [Arctogadus glacialis]